MRLERFPPTERRRGRLTICKPTPNHAEQLPSEQLPDTTLDDPDVQRFADWLHVERNRFTIEQAMRGGRDTGQRIGRGEAERRLKAALAELAKGGA